MNSRQFDTMNIQFQDYSTITILIAKIVLNCEIESEILILVVLSYCSISTMVSLFFYEFLFKYSFAYYLFYNLLSYALFWAVVEEMN